MSLTLLGAGAANSVAATGGGGGGGTNQLDFSKANNAAYLAVIF